MCIVLTIEESTQGLWCICREKNILHDKLMFAPAIRLARGMARQEHASSDQTVRVDLVCADTNFTLAQYDDGSGVFRPHLA